MNLGGILAAGDGSDATAAALDAAGEMPVAGGAPAGRFGPARAGEEHLATRPSAGAWSAVERVPGARAGPLADRADGTAVVAVELLRWSQYLR
jgi:hypothetical protein